MNPAIIAFLWIGALATVGGLVLAEPNMGSGNSFEDYGRLLTPLALLVGIVLYERIAGLKVMKTWAIRVRRFLAFPVLVPAMNWLMIFTLTDYRLHLRWLMLPLSLFLLCIGFLMVHWRIYHNANPGRIESNG